MSDVAELEKRAREALERAEKATEEPWEQDEYEPVCLDGPNCVIAYGNHELREFWANMEFLARARSDVPSLARAVLDLVEKNRDQENRLWTAAGEIHEQLEKEGQLLREIESLRRQLDSQTTLGNA